MIGGFENDRATFYTEEPKTVEDPISGEMVESGTEYTPEYKNVPVRSQQAALQSGAEHVIDAYGEWPMEVYTIFVDPRDVGEVKPDGTYEIGIGSNDRVELESSTGVYSLQPPALQRLDSQIPEFVQLEAAKTEVE